FCSKHKCAFPLLGQAFRIDVWVPHHPRGYERVRHSAASKDKAGEALVTAVRLADVDGVAVFFEWSAATRRVTRCVVAKRHVRRAGIVARLQSQTKEPIIQKRSPEAQAQAITLALAFLPIVCPCDAVSGRRRHWAPALGLASVVLVTQTQITVEFHLGDGGGQLPFVGAGLL